MFTCLRFAVKGDHLTTRIGRSDVVPQAVIDIMVRGLLVVLHTD